MIYFKKSKERVVTPYKTCACLILKALFHILYFLGIHFTSSACRSADNFRASTKR